MLYTLPMVASTQTAANTAISVQLTRLRAVLAMSLLYRCHRRIGAMKQRGPRPRPPTSPLQEDMAGRWGVLRHTRASRGPEQEGGACRLAHWKHKLAARELDDLVHVKAWRVADG